MRHVDRWPPFKCNGSFADCSQESDGNFLCLFFPHFNFFFCSFSFLLFFFSFTQQLGLILSTERDSSLPLDNRFSNI